MHTTLAPGTILDARYQVLSILGRGAMGTVYRVEHMGIGRELALKVLHQEMGTSPAVRERFTREARSTARLEHPGIVQVTDFGRTADDAPYMVMELVRGRQLSQLSSDEVSFERAVTLMQQVLRALEHAHTRQVVHRDLKPDNIMLVERDSDSPEDEVKILDFGLAMLLQPTGSPRITQAGAIFGTPRYMSPEQAAGETVDHRADLYSVAVMLTEVITGAALFDGATAAEVLAKQVTQQPKFKVPPQAGWNTDALQAVLRKALSKHPEDRFPDARALRKAVSACRSAEIPEAELSIADLDSVRPARAKRGVWIAAAVVAAVACVAFFMRGPNLSPLEEAFAANDLDQATQIAHTLLLEHPKSPRVHLYQGHIDFARGDVKDALASYGQALQLDASVIADAHFSRNVRTLVEHQDAAVEPMMRHLARHPTAAAVPLLTHIARAAHKWPVRRSAYETLEKIGEFGELDQITYLSEQLADNSTRVCTIRRWYLKRLVEMNDPRTVPALVREQSQVGCAKKLIARTLSKFEGSGRKL